MSSKICSSARLYYSILKYYISQETWIALLVSWTSIVTMLMASWMIKMTRKSGVDHHLGEFLLFFIYINLPYNTLHTTKLEDCGVVTKSLDSNAGVLHLSPNNHKHYFYAMVTIGTHLKLKVHLPTILKCLTLQGKNCHFGNLSWLKPTQKIICYNKTLVISL